MTSLTIPIRFMNNNYMGDGFTYSTQYSSGFAAANVYNTSRAKVWQPSGNFEITASNYLLYINDGTDKTITLDLGFYTSSTLALHIQTKLNISSSNWTCAYSSTTFKFTISQSVATTYTLRFAVTTTAVWDTLGYTETSNTVCYPSLVADEQRNHTDEWVKCDLGLAQKVTFCGILGPIAETFNLSPYATLKLQGSNIDYWAAPPIDTALDINDNGSFNFIDGETTASYRFWRIKIIDRTNPDGPTGIKIAQVYIGDDTSLTQSNLGVGIQKTSVDPSPVSYSENGAAFFESRSKYLTISNMQIKNLSGEEQRDIEQIFYELGVSRPFFVSFDPKLQVTNNLYQLTFYAFMSRPPSIQHLITDYYSFSFEMREAF
jgi:hypothetical protein